MKADQSPRRNPRHRTHGRAVRRLHRAAQAQTAHRWRRPLPARLGLFGVLSQRGGELKKNAQRDGIGKSGALPETLEFTRPMEWTPVHGGFVSWPCACLPAARASVAVPGHQEPILEQPGEGNVVECKHAGVAGDELTSTAEALESCGIAVDGISGLDSACLPSSGARLEIDSGRTHGR